MNVQPTAGDVDDPHLKNEFAAWEAASDQDFARMEAALTEPSLQEFARWLESENCHRRLRWLVIGLLSGIEARRLIIGARYELEHYITPPPPEFIQVLAAAAPGTEADAVIQARATLLREVAEFARGEE